MRKLPSLKKTYPASVVKQVEIALNEIGEITPWLDDETGYWMFEHPLYPESYGAETPEEVKAGYPLYLANMFHAQLKGNLDPHVEKQIKGRGGFRPGSGRPKQTPTKLVRLPVDIAAWIKEPEHLEQIRKMM
jgi:hypothetical protein